MNMLQLYTAIDLNDYCFGNAQWLSSGYLTHFNIPCENGIVTMKPNKYGKLFKIIYIFFIKKNKFR